MANGTRVGTINKKYDTSRKILSCIWVTPKLMATKNAGEEFESAPFKADSPFDQHWWKMSCVFALTPSPSGIYKMTSAKTINEHRYEVTMQNNGGTKIVATLFKNISACRLQIGLMSKELSVKVDSDGTLTMEGCIDFNIRENASKLLSDLSGWQDSEYSDVVFKCGEQQIKAIKFLLVKRSSVFSAQLSSTWTSASADPIPIDDDISFESFVAMLTYIHEAKFLGTTVKDIIDLLIVADRYAVTDLVSVCEKFICANLNNHNLVEALFLTELINTPDVMDACRVLISKQNFEDFENWETIFTNANLLRKVFATINIPQSKSRAEQTADPKSSPATT